MWLGEGEDILERRCIAADVELDGSETRKKLPTPLQKLFERPTYLLCYANPRIKLLRETPFLFHLRISRTGAERVGRSMATGRYGRYRSTRRRVSAGAGSELERPWAFGGDAERKLTMPVSEVRCWD